MHGDNSQSDEDPNDEVKQLEMKITNLKKAHKKEILNLKQQLDEKDDEIEELNAKLLKQTRLASRVSQNEFAFSSSNEVFRSNDYSLEQLEIQLNKERDIVNGLKIDIEELNKEKQKLLGDIALKDRKIDHSDKTIEKLEKKIKSLKNSDTNQISAIEDPHDFSRLTRKISNNQGSTNKEDDAQNYLIQTIEQKEGKILKLKTKIGELERKINELQAAKNHEAMVNPIPAQRSNKRIDTSSILDEIGKIGHTKFDGPDQCLATVRKWFAESIQKPMKSPKIFDDGKMTLGGKQAEIEQLNDRIYVLELTLTRNEKKYQSKLKEKDSEIEELQESLDNAQNDKTKESKNKAALKKLNETIEDLQSQLDMKTNEVEKNVKKNRDLQAQLTSANSKISDITDKNDNLTKQCNKQKDEIDCVHRESKNKIRELEDNIRSLSTDIAKSKNQFEKLTLMYNNEKQTTSKLNGHIDQLKLELDNCQNKLKNVTEKNNQLGNENKKQGTQINTLQERLKSMENEIQNIRINRFNKNELPKAAKNEREPESWHPNWWNQHKI